MSSTVHCQADADLSSALSSFGDRLGDDLLALRGRLTSLRSEAETLDSEFSGPLRRSLDLLLASGGTSVSEFLDLAGLHSGETREDLEVSFDDRYGLTIVDGRFLPDGDFDLSTLKELSRLLEGGLNEVVTRFPELADIAIDDASARGFTDRAEVQTDVLVLFTRLVEDIIPGSSDTYLREEVLGVDEPLPDVLAAHGLSPSDILTKIFWMGPSTPDDSVRTKFLSLGLTNSQFVDAVSPPSDVADSFISMSIGDPLDVVRTLRAFGDSTDRVLSRITRPVNLFPSTEESLFFLNEFIKRSVPGGSSPGDVVDYSSPSMALMTVLDVEKTFNTPQVVANIGIAGLEEVTDAAQAHVEAMTSAMSMSLSMSQTMMAEAQNAMAMPLQEMLALQGTAAALLNDSSHKMLGCLFGPAFSPSFNFPTTPPTLGTTIPGVPSLPTASVVNHMEDVLNLIESKMDIALGFADSISGIAGAIQGSSCTGSFVAQAGSFTTPPFDILPCLSDLQEDAGFEMPESYVASIDPVSAITDFVSSLSSSFRRNVSMARMNMNSLRQSIRATTYSNNPLGDISVPGLPGVPSIPGIPGAPGIPEIPGVPPFPGLGCSPQEASQLASLLTARATSSFTPST